MGQIVIWILKGIATIFGYLPRKVQLTLGWCLGSVLCLCRYRHAVVQQNLKIVFSDRQYPSPQDPKKFLSKTYTHFGNLILEVLMVLGPLKRFVEKYVDVAGYENFENAQKLGKGLIFLSSHVGNWEVMAATGGVLKKMDLMLVTKHLSPEWLHQAIEQGRLRCQVRATYEPRTLRDVLSHLKKGGTVGFVMDQYVGPPVGIRVPFFGKNVGTALVVAAIAKRTGAPVLPVENFRTPDGRWTVAVNPPVAWKEDPDSHLELALNTAQYSSVIEKHILSHPDQWLWVHRRFKGDLSPLRDGEWSEPRTRK